MLGRPFAEARMLSLGYSWQETAKPRLAPVLTPELP
jgi:hypothetical protein